ncbi:hypothetical protein PspLS_10143 [Pyricularia sp. CBS 133598]|nr:hypothetical protein PspLS_10143 [Pyricularia sp. CBS 133598]
MGIDVGEPFLSELKYNDIPFLFFFPLAPGMLKARQILFFSPAGQHDPEICCRRKGWMYEVAGVYSWVANICCQQNVRYRNQRSKTVNVAVDRGPGAPPSLHNGPRRRVRGFGWGNETAGLPFSRGDT